MNSAEAETIRPTATTSRLPFELSGFTFFALSTVSTISTACIQSAYVDIFRSEKSE
jgi:hypothetical protein